MSQEATIERLELALQDAKVKLREQDELIAQLTANPIPHGTVLQIFKAQKKLLILADGKLLEVEMPKDFSGQIGDIVKLSAQTLQVLEVSPAARLGELAIIDRVVEDNVAEIEHGGNKRLVTFDSEKLELRKNDRVVLDGSGHVILENKGHDTTHFHVEETSVTWDDIGGLDLAKEELIEAIEMPYKHPALYKFYNDEPVKGVLLYGPPGNGKTLLGKAAATSMAVTHKNVKSNSGFIYVKGPEILSKYVGIAEQTIRQLFDRARRHREEFGFPCVIFVDEADAILPKRGSTKSSDVEKTIVPQFLSEMDGMEDSGSLVILATNRADTLDPAVLRDGRVDRQIRISAPSRRSAEQIFMVHYRNVPVQKGCSPDDLIGYSVDTVFSEKSALYKITLKSGNNLFFGLEQILSGAMIAGIVKRSTKVALRRDRDRGNNGTGVGVDDVKEALENLLQEQGQLDHKEAIDNFANPHRKDVAKIERVV